VRARVVAARAQKNALAAGTTLVLTEVVWAGQSGLRSGPLNRTSLRGHRRARSGNGVAGLRPAQADQASPWLCADGGCAVLAWVV